SRHESVSLDAGQYGEEYETLTDHVTKDTAEYILEDEACMEIYQKLQGLKDDWKDMALLYFIEERTPVEVCEILKLKPTVFRMRLSRMRKYLREWLEQRENP
ncbi:MAG: RNA polymerase subunit sigma-24, partial [Hungatella sp.]